jgi:phosphatidylglycerol:prolipoprotein diacylglycerol transferase
MNRNQNFVALLSGEKQTKNAFTSVSAIIVIYVLIFWVVIPAFLFATGLRIDALLPIPVDKTVMTALVGWGFVLIGSVLIVTAIGELWFQGKGLPISHLPPTEFVVRGIYKYLRHPIYVGYTVAFAGTAILVGSFWSLTFSTFLLLVGWIGYALFYEEPILVARFGERYRDYRKTVALLLPKKPLRMFTAALLPYLEKMCRWLSAVANRTILFRRGNFILVTYGAFITIGTLIFTQHISALFLAQGVEQQHVAVFLVGAALSTMVCARLFWWLGHWCTMIQQPLFGLRNVGFVSWGGLTGLMCFSCVFARIYGYPALMITDAMLRGMFAAYALGRIGCLTYGCCYGVPSQEYGIVYENLHAKVIREKGERRALRHPTQMYSFLEGVILFVVVNAAAYGSLPVGFITATAFLLYPLGRTFIEFFRDRRRYVQGIFTEGHIGCFVMFLIGWGLLFFISPEVDMYSPKVWTSSAFAESLSLAPIVIVVGAIVFFVMGFHWKKVGTW